MALGPLVTGFYPFFGAMNPLWGSLFVYPIRWALSSSGFSPFLMVVFFGWPIVVIGGLVWASGKILDSESSWRGPATAVWILSILFAVPIENAMEYFPGWPVFCLCD